MHIYDIIINSYKFLSIFSLDKKINLNSSVKNRNLARQDASGHFCAGDDVSIILFQTKASSNRLAPVFSEESLGFLSVFFSRRRDREKEMSVTSDRTNDGNAHSVPFLTATVFSRRIRSAFNNSHAQRRTPRLVRDAGV